MGDLEQGLLDWSLSLDDWKRDLLRRDSATDFAKSSYESF